MTKMLLISQYSFDETHIDDNRAWGVNYTYFDPVNKTIGSCSVMVGFGEQCPYEFSKDWSEEDIANYHIVRENNFKKSVDARFEEFSKEAEEINANPFPQCKGQKVVITKGMHKGVEGTISWVGQNKFNKHYYHQKLSFRASAILAVAKYRPYVVVGKDVELVRVFPNDGSAPFYVPSENVKVIEGFIPTVVTREMCEGYVRNSSEFGRKLCMGYDCRSYVA